MTQVRPSTQIMAEGDPLQVLRINAAGTAIEAADPASGGAESSESTRIAAPAPGDAVWIPASVADVTVSALDADRSVTLAPTEAWEGDNCAEPNLWYSASDDLWHLIYTGGPFSAMAIGHATSPSPLGPWTKPANPIIGQGFGGWAGNAREPSVFIDLDGSVYVYFSPNSVVGAELHAGDLMVAHSDDPTSLVIEATPAMTPSGSATGIVNVSVVRDGDVYRMMFESRVSGTATWNTGYATASSPLGPFTIDTFPCTTLQRHTDGAYGGPMLQQTEDGWALVHHACGTTTGAIPTEIYRATSTDLVTWTQVSGIFIDLVDAYEVDQVADPFFTIGPDGAVWGVWSAMDNTGSGTSRVMISRATTGGPEWSDGGTWRPLLTTVQDEGTPVTARSTLDFVGEGVTVTDDAANGRTLVTVAAGVGQLLMQDGVTAPPVPLETEARDDWLYQE